MWRYPFTVVFVFSLNGFSAYYNHKVGRENFLKNKLWGDHFWSPSYFLATTGNVTIDILKEYVENQRKEQE